MVTYIKLRRNFKIYAIKGILILSLFSFVSPSVYAVDVLVLSPDRDYYAEMLNGLEQSIGDEIILHKFKISRQSSVQKFVEEFESIRPAAVIMVGNQSVSLYQRFQRINKERTYPPAIALATLHINSALSNVKNATGIRHDVPLSLAAAKLNLIAHKKVAKIGVIHRKYMSEIIERNSKLCEAEQIELVAIELPDKSSYSEKEIKRALKLLKRKKIDALWLVSDTALLNSHMMMNVWMPNLGKLELPVIVNTDRLASTLLELGSISVTPDDLELGRQAGALLHKLLDPETAEIDGDFENIQSVKALVNLNILDKNKVRYKREFLSTFDEIVE